MKALLNSILDFFALILLGGSVILALAAVTPSDVSAQSTEKHMNIEQDFYTYQDILFVEGNNLDTVTVYSEVCPKPIFAGSYMDAIAFVSYVSAVDVSNISFGEDYNDNIESYIDTVLESDYLVLANGFYKLDNNQARLYAEWAQSVYADYLNSFLSDSVIILDDDEDKGDSTQIEIDNKIYR